MSCEESVYLLPTRAKFNRSLRMEMVVHEVKYVSVIVGNSNPFQKGTP